MPTGLALLATIPGARVCEASAAPPSPPGQWAWLSESNWYVPQENLPAVQTDLETGEVEEVSDQTVFHIEEYSNGYFWGVTVVQIGRDPQRCLDMVASVTPDGGLQITFTPILPGVPPERPEQLRQRVHRA